MVSNDDNRFNIEENNVLGDISPQAIEIDYGSPQLANKKFVTC